MAMSPMLFPDGNVYEVPSAEVDRARNDFGAIPNPRNRDSVSVLFPDGALYDVPKVDIPQATTEYGGRLVTGRETFSLNFPDGNAYKVPIKQLETAVRDHGADISGLFQLTSPDSPVVTPQVQGIPQLSAWIGAPVTMEELATTEKGREYLDIQRRQQEGQSGFFENLLNVTRKDIPFFVGTALSAKEAVRISDIAKKLNKGTALTDDEAMDLNLYLAEQEREANSTALGMAGSILRQSIVFGSEFFATLAATGGLGAGASLAAKASSKGAKELVEAAAKQSIYQRSQQFMKQAAEKGVKRMTADASVSSLPARAFVGTAEALGFAGAVGAANTGISQAAQLAATGGRGNRQAAERAIYENLLGKEDPSFWPNLFSGVTADFIERFTEATGPFLMRGLKGTFTALPFGRQAGEALRDTLNRAIQRTGKDAVTEGATRVAGMGAVVGTLMQRLNKPAADVMALLERVGYNGVAEEFAEERLGGFLHGLLGTDGTDAGLGNAIDSMVPDMKQFWAEIIAFSMPMAYVGSVHKLAQLRGVGGPGVRNVRQFVQDIETAVKEPERIAFTPESEEGQRVTSAMQQLISASAGDLEGSAFTRWAATLLTLPFHWDINQVHYGSLTRALHANNIELTPFVAKATINSLLRDNYGVSPEAATEEQRTAAENEAQELLRQYTIRILQASVEVQDEELVQQLDNLPETAFFREIISREEARRFDADRKRAVLNKDAFRKFTEEEQGELVLRGLGVSGLTPSEMFNDFLNSNNVPFGLNANDLLGVMDGSIEDPETKAALLMTLAGVNPANAASLADGTVQLRRTADAVKRGALNPTRWFTGDMVEDMQGAKYMYVAQVPDSTEDIYVVPGDRIPRNETELETLINEVDRRGLPAGTIPMKKSAFRSDKINSNMLFLTPAIITQGTASEWIKFFQDRIEAANKPGVTDEQRKRLLTIIGGLRVEDLYDPEEKTLINNTELTNTKLTRKVVDADGNARTDVTFAITPGALSYSNGDVSLMVGHSRPMYHVLEDSGESVRKQRALQELVDNKLRTGDTFMGKKIPKMPARERTMMQEVIDFLKTKRGATYEGESAASILFTLLTDKDGKMDEEQAFEIFGKLAHQRIHGFDAKRYGMFETLMLHKEIEEGLPDDLNEIRPGFTDDLISEMTLNFGAGHTEALFNPYADRGLLEAEQPGERADEPEQEEEVEEEEVEEADEAEAAPTPPADTPTQQANRAREVVKELLGRVSDAIKGGFTTDEARAQGQELRGELEQVAEALRQSLQDERLRPARAAFQRFARSVGTARGELAKALGDAEPKKRVAKAPPKDLKKKEPAKVARPPRVLTKEQLEGKEPISEEPSKLTREEANAAIDGLEARAAILQEDGSMFDATRSLVEAIEPIAKEDVSKARQQEANELVKRLDEFIAEARSDDMRVLLERMPTKALAKKARGILSGTVKQAQRLQARIRKAAEAKPKRVRAKKEEPKKKVEGGLSGKELADAKKKLAERRAQRRGQGPTASLAQYDTPRGLANAVSFIAATEMGVGQYSRRRPNPTVKREVNDDTISAVQRMINQLPRVDVDGTSDRIIEIATTRPESAPAEVWGESRRISIRTALWNIINARQPVQADLFEEGPTASLRGAAAGAALGLATLATPSTGLGEAPRVEVVSQAPWFDSWLSDLKEIEKFRAATYLDSESNRTVGVGHNLETDDPAAFERITGKSHSAVLSGDETLTEEEGDRLLSFDAGNSAEAAARDIPGFFAFSPDTQKAISDLYFWGVYPVKFKKSLAALKRGDMLTATDELIDSRMHTKLTDTPGPTLNRWLDNIQAIEGQISVDAAGPTASLAIPKKWATEVNMTTKRTEPFNITIGGVRDRSIEESFTIVVPPLDAYDFALHRNPLNENQWVLAETGIGRVLARGNTKREALKNFQNRVNELRGGIEEAKQIIERKGPLAQFLTPEERFATPIEQDADVTTVLRESPLNDPDLTRRRIHKGIDIIGGVPVGADPRRGKQTEFFDENKQLMQWANAYVNLEGLLEDVDTPRWRHVFRAILAQDKASIEKRIGFDSIARAGKAKKAGAINSQESLMSAARNMAITFAGDIVDNVQDNEFASIEELDAHERYLYLGVLRYIAGTVDDPREIQDIIRDRQLADIAETEAAIVGAEDTLDVSLRFEEADHNATNTGETVDDPYDLAREETDPLKDNFDKEEEVSNDDIKDKEEDKLREVLEDRFISLTRRFIDMHFGQPASSYLVISEAVKAEPAFVPPTSDNTLAEQRAYFLWNEGQFREFVESTTNLASEEATILRDVMRGMTYQQALYFMQRVGRIRVDPSIALIMTQDGFLAKEISENPTLNILSGELHASMYENLLLDPMGWMDRFEDIERLDRQANFEFFSDFLGLDAGTSRLLRGSPRKDKANKNKVTTLNTGLLESLHDNFRDYVFSQEVRFDPDEVDARTRVANTEGAIDSILTTPHKNMGAPENKPLLNTPLGFMTRNIGNKPGFYAQMPGLGRFESFSLPSPLLDRLPSNYQVLRIAAVSQDGTNIRANKAGPEVFDTMSRHAWDISERIANKDELIVKAPADLGTADQQKEAGRLFITAANLLAGGKRVFNDFTRKRETEDEVALSSLANKMVIYYPRGDKSSVYALVTDKPEGAETFDEAYRIVREELDDIITGISNETIGSVANHGKRSGLYISSGRAPILTENGLPQRMRSVTIQIGNQLGQRDDNGDLPDLADGGMFFALPGISEKAKESLAKFEEGDLHNIKGHVVGRVDGKTGGIFKPMGLFIEHMSDNPLFAELMMYVKQFNDAHPKEPLTIVFDAGAAKVSPVQSRKTLTLETLRNRARNNKEVISPKDTYFVRTTDFRETTNVESKATPEPYNQPVQNTTGMEMFSPAQRVLMERYLQIAISEAEKAVASGDFAALNESGIPYVRMLAKAGLDGRFLAWADIYHPVVASRVRKILREEIYGFRKVPEVVPEHAMTEDDIDFYNKVMGLDIAPATSTAVDMGRFRDILPGIDTNVVSDYLFYDTGELSGLLKRAARVRMTVDAPMFRYGIRIRGLTREQIEEAIKDRMDTKKDLRKLNKNEFGEQVMQAERELKEAFPQLKQISYAKQRFADLFNYEVQDDGTVVQGTLNHDEIQEVAPGEFIIAGSIAYITRVPRGGLDAHTLVRVMTPYYGGAPFIAVHPDVAMRAGTDQDADARKIEFLQYNTNGELVLDEQAERAVSRAGKIPGSVLEDEGLDDAVVRTQRAEITNARFLSWVQAFKQLPDSALKVIAGATRYDDIVIPGLFKEVTNEDGEVEQVPVTVGKALEDRLGGAEDIQEFKTAMLQVESELAGQTIGLVAKLNTAIQNLVHGGLLEVDDLSDLMADVEAALQLPKATPTSAISTPEAREAALRELFTNFLTQVIDVAKHQNTEPLGLTPDMAPTAMVFAMLLDRQNDMDMATALVHFMRAPIIMRYQELRKTDFFNAMDILEEEFVQKAATQEEGVANNQVIELLRNIDVLSRSLFRAIRIEDINGRQVPTGIASYFAKRADIENVENDLVSLTPSGEAMVKMSERVLDTVDKHILRTSQYAPATTLAQALVEMAERVRMSERGEGQGFPEDEKGELPFRTTFNAVEYEKVSREIHRIAMVESMLRGKDKIRQVAEDANLHPVVDKLMEGAYAVMHTDSAPEGLEEEYANAHEWLSKMFYSSDRGIEAEASRYLNEDALDRMQRGFISGVDKQGNYTSPLFQIMLKSDELKVRSTGKGKKRTIVENTAVPGLEVSRGKFKVTVDGETYTLTESEAAKALLTSMFSVWGPILSIPFGSPIALSVSPSILGNHLVELFEETARIWNTERPNLDPSYSKGYNMSETSPLIQMAQRLRSAIKYNSDDAVKLASIRNSYSGIRGVTPDGEDYYAADGLEFVEKENIGMLYNGAQPASEPLESLGALAQSVVKTMAQQTRPRGSTRSIPSKDYEDMVLRAYYEPLRAMDQTVNLEERDAVLDAMLTLDVPQRMRMDQHDVINYGRLVIEAVGEEGRRRKKGEQVPEPLKSILDNKRDDAPGLMELASTSAEALRGTHDPDVTDSDPPSARSQYDANASLALLPTTLANILSPNLIYGPRRITTGVQELGKLLQDEAQKISGYNQRTAQYTNFVYKYLGITRYGGIHALTDVEKRSFAPLSLKAKARLNEDEIEAMKDFLWLTGALRESEPVEARFKKLKRDIELLKGKEREKRAAADALMKEAFADVAQIARDNRNMAQVTWGNEYTDIMGNKVKPKEDIITAFERLTSGSNSAIRKLKENDRRIDLELLAEISFQDFDLLSDMQRDFPWINKRNLYITHRFSDGRLSGQQKEAREKWDDMIGSLSRHREGEFFLGEAEYDLNFEEPAQAKTDDQQQLYERVLGDAVDAMVGITEDGPADITAEAAKARMINHFNDKWKGANRFDANSILASLIRRAEVAEIEQNPAAYDVTNPENRKWIKTYRLLRESVRGYKSKEWTGRQISRTREGTYAEEYDATKGALKPQTINVLELQNAYVREVGSTSMHRTVVNAMMTVTDEDGMPLVTALPSDLVDPNDATSALIHDETYRINAFLMANALKMDFNVAADPIPQLEEMVKRRISTKDKEWKKQKSPFPTVAVFYSQAGDATKWLKHITHVEKQLIIAGQDIFQWAMRMTQWAKIMSVGWSIFFPVALGESLVAGTGIRRNILRNPIKAAKQMKEIMRDLSSVSGIYSDFANELGFVGFELGHAGAADKPIGIVEEDTEFMKNKITRRYGAKQGRAFERAVRTMAGKGASDFFFGSLFPAMKIWAAYRMANEAAVRLDPKKYTSIDDVTDGNARTQILSSIAPQINDAYGGQFWFRYPWANPRALQYLNLFMFAPNWTLSAWNIAGGGVLTGQILNNTMSNANTDFVFKQNWPAMWLYVILGFPALLQSSMWLTAVAAGVADDDDVPLPLMNEKGRKTYMDVTPFVRQMPWYTGDPTGKRRYYIRFGKQSFEVIDGWATEPIDQLLRKMSNPAKAIFEQVTGTSPGSDWNLEFSGMGFLGFFKSKDEEALQSFANSRFGYLVQKFLPMSASTLIKNPETFIFNFIAPTSKGMSQGKAVGALVTILNTYANNEEWKKYQGNPKARTNLESMAPAVLEAARRNGYNTDKIVTSAKGVVLGGLYKKFWTALNNGNTDRMNILAAGIWRVGGTLKGLKTSMSNKASGYNRALTEDEERLINEAFRS